MSQGLVIVGAGGHGREVLGVVRRAGLAATLIGFIDDGAPDEEAISRLGVPHVGSLAEVVAKWEKGSIEVRSAVIGVGSGEVRSRVDAGIPSRWSAPVLIHPDASMDDDVRIGAGSIIFAQSTVTTNIEIGRHSHIGRGAAIGHDCRIGSYVTVLPLAAVSGNVSLATGSTIGSGAVIREGVSVGEGAFVGAGAVVLNDVPAHRTVVGNPARLLNRFTI